MGERFKIASLQAEISHLVKSDPKAVQDVAEALHFLLGDRLEQDAKAALKASNISKSGKSANFVAVVAYMGSCTTSHSYCIFPTTLW